MVDQNTNINEEKTVILKTLKEIDIQIQSLQDKIRQLYVEMGKIEKTSFKDFCKTVKVNDIRDYEIQNAGISHSLGGVEDSKRDSTSIFDQKT